MHIFLQLYLFFGMVVEKRAWLSVSHAMYSVIQASHATEFNLSVGTALTSERERNKAEETGEGEEAS